MSFTAETYQDRRRRVLAKAKESADFDALCITDPVNVRYLTGLTEGCYKLFLSDDGDLMLVTWMFYDRAKDSCPGLELGLIAPPLGDATTETIKEHKWSRIAVIERETSLKEWRNWTDRMGDDGVIAISDAVMSCRLIKDETEVALMTEAVRIAENAFLELCGRGRDYFIGKTERELALELEILMRSNGAEDQSFPNGIILATGANSYGAHYVPALSKVEDGHSILMDWGAVVDGYCSDMTRIVAVGDIPERIIEMHTAVKQAVAAALAVIKPGVESFDVDAAARQVFLDAGFDAKAFRHGLGHAIGLEVHEALRFHPDRAQCGIIEAGMVMTVEPGVYLPDIGGVRLEHDVLVTESGCEVMGELPLDIVRLD